jgi:hypothetical protein
MFNESLSTETMRKTLIYIDQVSDATLSFCESKMVQATLLGKEARTNHSAQYPLHNRYFSNGDKPWVVLINTKNKMKLIYDGVEHIINENHFVFFDDNVMHAWEMQNNDMTIYYYRAKAEHPIRQGTYCLDQYF